MFCIACLGARDTIRGTVLFWELVGIHPGEANADPKAHCFRFAWAMFASWKAATELAVRASAVHHIDANRFQAASGFYRLVTHATLLETPSRTRCLRAVRGLQRHCRPGMTS
jgi:hypothetical protein